MDLATNGITLYTTCRSSIGYGLDAHLRNLVQTAQWAEEAGYRGALIYSDSASIDAWLSAQAAIANTDTFIPLIAVQPLDKTPFAAARAISSLAHLYHRQVDLNYVSGGFSRDLSAQGDRVSHDARYDRLVEYATVVNTLLHGSPTTYAGSYYNMRRARLTTAVPTHLHPTAYVSGSSPASRHAAETLGLTQLSFPIPPDDYANPQHPKNKNGVGISLGIIARDSSAEAWRIAHKRFPTSPEGAERMKLLLSTSISTWQPQLAAIPTPHQPETNTYWLDPFNHHHTFCPYLVGNHQEVAHTLATYLNAGARTLILDLPQEPDDLHHARTAIELAATTLHIATR